MPFIRQVVTSSSFDRLEKLIELRLQVGADTAVIDERIWNLFGEEWAVMMTDLSGFSRSVAEFGIIHFLQIIYESQRMLVPCIDDHDGVLLKVEGDSMLVIFRNPARAFDCAVEMQRILAEYNLRRKSSEQVLLGLGIGVGRVLRIGDADVYGAEVNAASKLGEDRAGPGEILVTENVRLALANRAGVLFQQLDKAPPGAVAAYRVTY